VYGEDVLRVVGARLKVELVAGLAVPVVVRGVVAVPVALVAWDWAFKAWDWLFEA
jgi:hypothetical protein